MEIVIPASIDKINVQIDDRLGRCWFFCFYNQDMRQTDFKENANISLTYLLVLQGLIKKTKHKRMTYYVRSSNF